MRSQPIEKKEGFWRAFARILSNWDDALNTTEASLLERRVVRLEREVRLLQAQRPAHPQVPSAAEEVPG
jgi:hypothetical protein